MRCGKTVTGKGKSGTAAKMARSFQDEDFREKLKRNAVVQVKKFSWDQSAVKAIRVFEQMQLENRSNNVTDTAMCDRLIASIAAIPGNPGEQDLLMTASAMAINFVRRATRQN